MITVCVRTIRVNLSITGLHVTANGIIYIGIKIQDYIYVRVRANVTKVVSFYRVSRELNVSMSQDYCSRAVVHRTKYIYV